MNALRAGLVTLALAATMPAQAALHVAIIQGLGGEPAYETEFAAQVRALRTAEASLTDQVHVLEGDAATKAQVQALFRTLAASVTAADRVAVYLIGHGSFDGDEYKFNVRGPDLTGHEILSMLNALPARDQLVVATGSSSGALQELLKSDTRVVLTATRSGAERNATHFGTEFVAALQESAGDTDKNGTVSAQEAFDFAQRKVKEYFERDVKLATEHALLQGERAARFPVARLAAAAGATVAAADNPERARITDALDALRLRKEQLPAAEYESQLEKLLLQLAELDAAPAATESKARQ